MDRISAKVFIAVSLFIAILFGLKDMLILSVSSWPHLFPVVNTTFMTFEEVYCYLPNVSHFSLHTLLPAAPMADPGLSKLTVFPPVTMVFQGALLKWIFLSNTDAYLLFVHVAFPLASFWLLVLVYRRYISIAWAILLAFWGVTFFNNYSTIHYLRHLAVGHGAFIESGSLNPMEITRTPVPSFTFFFFILCFYLSTRTYRISAGRYALYTALWSLNLYVYLYNFIAGMLFWFCYMVFTRYISDRSFDVKAISRTLGVNLIVMSAMIIPYFLNAYSLIYGGGGESLDVFGLVHRNAGPVFNQWGVFVSYIMPVALTAAVIRLYYGDYYELFYRFTPIFLMIVVEIFVMNLHLVFGSFFQSSIFSTRIGNFFSRFLYFVPIIYFLSNPFKRLFHDDAGNGGVKRMHAFFQDHVIRYRAPIAALGVAAIAFVAFSSSIKYYRNHEGRVAPRMAAAQERFMELAALQKAGSMAVSDDIAVNLLMPVLSRNPTLLVNSFNNYDSVEDMLRRLALFARIYDWDRERYLDFMLPDRAYEDFYNANDFTVSDNMLEKGFGFWLVWHRRTMSREELAVYRERLLGGFDNLDLRGELKRYGVSVVQARGRVNPSLPVGRIIPGVEVKNYILTI